MGAPAPHSPPSLLREGQHDDLAAAVPQLRICLSPLCRRAGGKWVLATHTTGCRRCRRAIESELGTRVSAALESLGQSAAELCTGLHVGDGGSGPAAAQRTVEEEGEAEDGEEDLGIGPVGASQQAGPHKHDGHCEPAPRQAGRQAAGAVKLRCRPAAAAAAAATAAAAPTEDAADAGASEGGTPAQLGLWEPLPGGCLVCRTCCPTCGR